MKICILPVLAIALLISSCTKTEDIQEKRLPYVGTYDVSGTHIIGIVTTYDSTGSVIYMGYDTIALQNEIIDISLLGDTDSLLVDGLVTSHYPSNGWRSSVKAVLSGTEIIFDYDNSDAYDKDILKGSIMIEEDAIQLEYEWNTSDIYSYGALPVFGSVEAVGSRQ